MPWIERPQRSTLPMSDYRTNLPERGARVDAAVAEAMEQERKPRRGRKEQLAGNVRALLSVTNNAMEEMASDAARGWEPRTNKALVAEYAKRLPPSARETLLGFLDEARPVVLGGEPGLAREGVRKFAWETAERLTDVGWRPPPEDPAESPAAMAAMIPRGG